MLNKATAWMDAGHENFLAGVVSAVSELVAAPLVFLTGKLTDPGVVGLLAGVFFVWSLVTAILMFGGIHQFMKGGLELAHRMLDSTFVKQAELASGASEPSRETLTSGRDEPR